MVHGVWRSLVAHLLWEQRVGGSNPLAPTKPSEQRFSLDKSAWSKTTPETRRMLARILRPAKTAMQSGRAKTHLWELQFEPASARVTDPLMGWTQSTDMNGQVRIPFATRDEAIAYARRHGIAFEVVPEGQRKIIIKAYADNFAFHRKQPWTH
jgi:hypothetical protein